MKIIANAKINLGLKVLGRRADGYHELETIMQQVSFCDHLSLRGGRGYGWQFKCSHPRLEGEENLVCRAARSLEKRAGKTLPGVKIGLFKNIPPGSGLGGGSSNAAAALQGLNKFWKLGLSTRELAALGADLGSDIPFFLVGEGTALARGRGEKITPLPGLPFFWVVLALPSRLRISTASVYGALEEKMPAGPPVELLQEAILNRDRGGILGWFSRESLNGLQPGVLARYPGLCLLQKRMRQLGLAPVMSGSGPAFFALTASYDLSSQAARVLQAEGYRAILCWTVQKNAAF